MVIVAGAPTRDSMRGAGPQVLFPANAPPEVKVAKDRTTASFDIHASVEEVLDGHERIRLQYVAATRARDLLVLSAHHRVGMQSSGARFWEALARCPDRWRAFERRGDERYLAEPPTQLRLAAGSFAEVEAAWRDEQQRLLQASEGARVWSATGVATHLDPGPPQPSGAVVENELAVPARAGTAIGTAVHATLQVAAFDAGPDDLAGLAARAAAQAGVPEHAGEVAELAAAVLRAPVMALAREQRHWRELHVAAPVGGGLLEGFIDLCVETPEGLVVVDYKTDRVGSVEEVDRKLAHYRWQGAAYALALAQISGRPVVDCRFIFVAHGEPIERSVADLPRIVAEVRELLAPTPKSADSMADGH